MNEKQYYPLAAWFLGPKAEHGTMWSKILDYIFQDYIHWRRNYFPEDQVVVDRSTRRSLEDWFDLLNTNIDQLLSHLKADYPFYSPRYMAHMLSEQSLPSVAGYIAGMLYNPNNVTPEAAPITVELELEVGKMISEMLGFEKEKSWAHMCSGGTIANLEAMWVSRITLATPIIIQQFCKEHKLSFEIELSNGENQDIRVADPYLLMQLVPERALELPRQLLNWIVNDPAMDQSLIQSFNTHFDESPYNVNSSGVYDLLKDFDLEPIIFVSEAVHYCFKKVGNLLGFGKSCVKSIPVDSDFRMRMDALEDCLWKLKPNQVVLGVIGILGTTEEGAIDPIHKIYKLRKRLELEKNRSFWLHIDGAWGGYLRSMLLQNKPDGRCISLDVTRGAEVIFEEYFQIKSIEEKFYVYNDELEINWKDLDLFSALLYTSEADSITIDPHKLGYIPYPSGVICFRNNLVTELVTQEAPYITSEKVGFDISKSRPTIDKVGPFIIEGSKPGAAAASAWLAHKSIPLDNHSHGKLMRTSILNTRKIYSYLCKHKDWFPKIEQEVFGEVNVDDPPFSFKPLCEPDSNIICYMALPYQWHEDKIVPRKCSLEFLNQLNEEIYEVFSLDSRDGKHKMPYGQEFFVSKTRLLDSTYKATSISFLLENFGISEEEYRKHGVFVLRSTIMNPWYYLASKSGAGTDYLLKFVEKLHEKTKFIMKKMV